METKNSQPEVLSWHLLSGMLVCISFILLISQWFRLPFFLDIYYHLNVVQGFSKAGGISLWDFWEFAPSGRVHLYPPLVHLLMLWMSKLGYSLLFIARLFSILFFLFLELSLWVVISKLFSARLAFFALACLFFPYSFVINCTIFLPITLCLIFLLWIYFLLERQRPQSAGAVLGLSFYVHLGFPWIMVLAFLLYGFWRKKKEILLTLGIGILLGLPWIFHFLANRQYFRYHRAMENYFLEFNFFIVIMAAIGFVLALRKKEHHFFLVLFSVLFFFLGFSHPYRFLSAEGLFGFVLLASFSFEALYTELKLALQILPVGRQGYFNQRPIYHTILPLFLVYSLYFISPCIVDTETGSRFVWRNSALTNLLPGYIDFQRRRAASLYNQFAEEIIKVVKSNSKEDELIYSNYEYYGGLISAFAARANAWGMLHEVRPEKISDPIAASRLIIFIKTFEGKLGKTLQDIVKDYRLEKIFENGIAFIYKNPKAEAKIEIKQAAISTKLALILLAIWLGVICFLVYRKK